MLVGVAGASLVTGVFFASRAVSAKAEYDAAPSLPLLSRVERETRVADLAFVTAACLGAVGGFFLYTNRAPSPSGAATTRTLTARVAPLLAPSRAGGVMEVSF